ncbi:MAG: sigma-54 dependent transcriptional regulator [Gammaproteobacteria bacterium]|nr:sigma-54 dependent transcriptional regulator [Gammaproteobacteria bacterium]MBT8124076.1 sigma-54 dependent transcriptional regulator [Gammaproteobacteria bacterium]NNC68660.1 sigma-54-dependent Fis family transcriptional regulator [Gammaproteobacteria bacterium]
MQVEQTTNKFLPESSQDLGRRKNNKSLLDGHSKAVQQVSDLIERVANTNANVLILGESGTGKEVVARSIHTISNRSSKYFVPVNCAAIPQELLESELFGHIKGAFTGAITDRKGRFELAEGGTLFLDEIGDMDLNMQAKLLRVLQEKVYERVGSGKPIHANVRVIAATHRNLEEMVAKGEFREDLYYRLHVYPIDLPPLRRRAEDLPSLVYAITDKIKQDTGTHVNVTPDAMSALARYTWPGNVRELSNLLERLSILYPGKVVDATQLPSKYSTLTNTDLETSEFLTESVALNEFAETEHFDQSESNSINNVGLPILTRDGVNLKSQIASVEQFYIKQALDLSNGVVAQAAKLLGLRRTTLVEKLKKHEFQRTATS